MSIQGVGVCECVYEHVAVCTCVFVCAHVLHVRLSMSVCEWYVCTCVCVCFYHLLITPALWGFNPRAHICLKHFPRGLAAVSSKPKDTGFFTWAAF